MLDQGGRRRSHPNARRVVDAQVPLGAENRDARFTAAFDAAFAGIDARVIRMPVRATRANAIAERLVGSIRRELLDRLLIINQRHAAAVLREYQCPYNHHRPHRSLGQAAPLRPLSRRARATTYKVDRRDRLGGLLHEYQQVAGGAQSSWHPQVESGELVKQAPAYSLAPPIGVTMSPGELVLVLVVPQLAVVDGDAVGVNEHPRLHVCPLAPGGDRRGRERVYVRDTQRSASSAEQEHPATSSACRATGISGCQPPVSDLRCDRHETRRFDAEAPGRAGGDSAGISASISGGICSRRSTVSPLSWT